MLPLCEIAQLYTSRLILSCASLVWRTMFTSNCKEKSISEIPLPGKEYQAVLELLYCIMPGVKKSVTRKANLYINIIIFNKYKSLDACMGLSPTYLPTIPT